MPRGSSPNSQKAGKKNLIQNQGLSREEVRKVNSKGGKNAAKAKRANRRMKEHLLDSMTEKERTALAKDILKRMHVNLDWLKYGMQIIGEDPSGTNAESAAEGDGFLEALQGEASELFSDGDDSKMVGNGGE